MSDPVVNKWLSDNYENILNWAKNVNQGKSDWADLAHYAIEAFSKMPSAKGAVKKGQGRFLMIRIMLNSCRSTTSEFARTYRPAHSSLTTYDLDDPDEEYDHEIDTQLEKIESVLDEMLTSSNSEIWYRGKIFQLCLEQPRLNFSELSRETGIPRTSISNAYYETIEWIKNKVSNE